MILDASTVVFLDRFLRGGETTTVAQHESLLHEIKFQNKRRQRASGRLTRNAGLRCHIIYSMLSAQHQCLIIAVGEIKPSKKNPQFKTAVVRVKTKEIRDNDTGDITRESGEFDCEVIANDEPRFKLLVDANRQPDVFLPCFFILRSFWYTEKNQEKLGKQLQLKRWWR